MIADVEWSLVAFLGASGYASSSILYNLGDTPFVHNGFTVGEIEVGPLILGSVKPVQRVT